MKCQDYLPSLETGRWWQRLAARRHAARCPRCAAARLEFEAAIRELAQPAEVSPELKARWRQATNEPLPAARQIDAPRKADIQTASASRRRLAIAIACAASIAAIVGVAWWQWPDNGQQRPAATADVHEVETSQEFTRLESSLALLDGELRQVERDIERMQARQLAAELMRSHGQP